MRERTRKHHIEEKWRPYKKPLEGTFKESENWRKSVKEVFGDLPSSAINLRGLRNREGLTQKQLGQAIGVEQSNISKMETGKRHINPKIAKQLEKLFDIDHRLFL